jgi:DNA-binding CsgD family transcriptional regulator/class 3 adenylate cyclase
MPLYMDRHDLPQEGLTAEQVAELHSADLKVQGKYGVKMLTYWWHEGASAGFCLIESPSKEAAEATHREAHGGVPSRIIEVDWRSVEAFLGPVRCPAPGEPWKDVAFKTIVCVAIDELSEQGSVRRNSATQLFRGPQQFARKALDARGGRLVRDAANPIIGCFLSVPAALECSLAIRQSFLSVGFLHQHARIEMRIGVSAGEPVTRHMGVFGRASAEAEALCAKARPGEILVSRPVRDLCEKRGFTFDRVKETSVPGLEGPIRYCSLNGRNEDQTAAIAEPFLGHGLPNRLSTRELDVLRLIAAGKTNQEIADGLFISLSTVASHVRNIFDKINVSNRTEATSFAYRNRLA